MGAKGQSDHCGVLLDKRFRLMEFIHDGSRCWIYKGIDNLSNEKIAAKVLKKQFITNQRAVQRLIQESATLRILSHPNLVKFYSSGKTTDGEYYLIMEFLTGNTLRKLIDENPEGLPLKPVLSIFKQAAEGITHAHERGFLHRNISPNNIIVSDFGTNKLTAKVVDFSAVKVTEFSQSQALVKTTPGEALGSFPYMSPEQIDGKKLDAKTDIYSLGCVMYEALTGISPFKQDMAGKRTMPKAPSQLKKELSSIPEIEEIIGKAIAREPSDRFQIMPEFGVAVMALEEKLGGGVEAVCQKLLAYMNKHSR